MKQIKLVIAALLTIISFIMTSGGFVSAQEESTLNASVGVKGWVNQWETGFINDDSSIGQNLMVTTGSKFTLIPVLAVKYKDFFVSGSYYMKSNFSFNKFSYRINYSGSAGNITETLESSADRTEWDANIGYYIHPSVALSLGYKNITQDYTSKYSSPGITYSQPTSKSTTEIKGPAIGITGNVPISGGFGMYGNLAYGWLKAKYTGVTREDSITYILTDTGFNYRVSSVLINLGYRYQAMYTDVPSGLRGPDITGGIVLGANWLF